MSLNCSLCFICEFHLNEKKKAWWGQCSWVPHVSSTHHLQGWKSGVVLTSLCSLLGCGFLPPSISSAFCLFRMSNVFSPIKFPFFLHSRTVFSFFLFFFFFFFSLCTRTVFSKRKFRKSLESWNRRQAVANVYFPYWVNNLKCCQQIGPPLLVQTPLKECDFTPFASKMI